MLPLRSLGGQGTALVEMSPVYCSLVSGTLIRRYSHRTVNGGTRQVRPWAMWKGQVRAGPLCRPAM